MNVTSVVDLQFGSTGKGLLCGYLAHEFQFDAAACAFAPNAGHTYVTADGTRHVHMMLPIAAISPQVNKVFIGPGAVIDPGQLQREIVSSGLAERINKGEARLFIHENAAVVTHEHREQEAALLRIGSTRKGAMAAMVQKLQRDSSQDNRAKALMLGTLAEIVDSARYMKEMTMTKSVLLEGAQGYSLSVHHGYWPYVTSRDTTHSQLMADCAVPLGAVNAVQRIGTMRTYPIRVANRFDDTGRQVGWSGPCYPDQIEINWNTLGVEPELTTVTKLPRRVFSFSWEQIRQAIHMNGIDSVFLNFVNYWKTFDEFNDFQKKFLDRVGDGFLHYYGIGPGHNDVIDSSQHVLGFDGVAKQWKKINP